MGKQAAKAKREDGPDYEWTEADYKRASAPSSLDFVRFNALRDFDRQNGVHNKSRRAYALLINKRIRDIDVPDTRRKRKKMEESSSKTDNNNKKKSKKESFDPDGPAMREEIERRIKYANWLRKVNKERMKGKKKEGSDDDDDDPDGEAMGREFTRRIKWSYDLNKKCGAAAVDAAAKLLNEAEDTVYSS